MLNSSESKSAILKLKRLPRLAINEGTVFLPAIALTNSCSLKIGSIARALVPPTSRVIVGNLYRAVESVKKNTFSLSIST